ncbi:MAG: hypothetical protein Q9165_005580 [Trypethelium subeluteriae]
MSSTESSKVEFLAVCTVKPGKLERAKALTTAFIDSVKAHEPNTLSFHMVEEVDATEPRLIMVESYKDRASMDAHTESPYFKTLFATFEGEDVFVSAPQQYVGKVVAGFAR